MWLINCRVTLFLGGVALLLSMNFKEHPSPTPDPVGSALNDTLHYLFLGHTYDWSRQTQHVDFRIEAMDPRHL